MKNWTSDELVAQMRDRLLQLRAMGVGRRRAADLIAEETCRPCGSSVVAFAFRKLSEQQAKAGTAHTRSVKVEDVSDIDPADGDTPIEELIEHRITASQRKRLRASAHARTLELPPEPVGVMVFGDPHVDNEGCDWASLRAHVKLAQDTPGVLAACVGDVQDNWIGRLQRLYANSSMMASDGWRLSQWLLESLQWIAVVGGNHDQWAHAPGVDPLKWVSKQAKVMCYADDEIRMTLTWRKRPDFEPLIWVLRHDFQGRSWFHPTHGPHREAMLDGKCHIFTAGHIHQWGQLTTEQRHDRVTTAFRVRGYKRDDAHARRLGFDEQRYGESVMMVIDPCAQEPGRVKLFWDLQVGCEYLTWLRSK